jgi:hypothetical protein
MVRIYRQLEGGELLCGAGDPGNGLSYSAAVFISRKYKDVPITFQARVESPQFGYELNNLGYYIKKKTGDFPLLAVERNIGQGTIEKLRDLGYPLDKLYRQKTFDRVSQKEEERIGWTTTVANRRKMLDTLAMAIRNKELKIYDKELISEMLTFVIQERTGEPRPESGTFSDLIMACAIAYQMLDEYPVKAQWHTSKKHERPSKFLPQKADGFIVEKHDPNANKDWREV